MCGTEQWSGTAWLHMWPSEWAAAGFGISYPEDSCMEETGSSITHVSGPSQPSPVEAARGYP